MEFETWPSIRPDLFTMTDSFLHENQALTSALVTSLSESSATESAVQTQSVSKPEPAMQSNRVTNGRVTKRKSRVSKKAPTTYINADPANFRQMVQQITGVSGSGQDMGRAFEHLEFFRPEPVRGEFGFLPTIDTSAGLLGPSVMDGGYGSGSGVGLRGSGFGFDGNGFRFPTLESWSAM